MKEKGKKKKIVLTVLLILLLLIGLLVVFIIFKGKQNKKQMNGLVENGLHAVQSRYNVEQLDAGEYTDMTLNGFMKFHVDQYKVEDLGNLSVMTADMGFMQMLSFMITPVERNVPLCALDFMYIAGNRKSYVEFYDVVENPQNEQYVAVLDSLREMTARYNDVEDVQASENWYDYLLNVVMLKQLKDDDRNAKMFNDSLETYLDAAKNAEVCTPEGMQKHLDVTQEYSDGLIDKGGVSTDVFKKELGEAKTRDFFNKVFFGTELYR